MNLRAAIEAQSQADADALRERLPALRERLPPLPDTEYLLAYPGSKYEDEYITGLPGWAEHDARAYGQQCRAQTLEEAAKVCRGMASVALSPAAAFALVDAAERIRALKETP